MAVTVAHKLAHPRKTLGILLFDEVEVLDFCGPFEVFTATRIDEIQRAEQPSPFVVYLIAEHLRTITTTGGMRVQPDRSFADCPALDLLVVPGGRGTRREMHNPAVLDFVRQHAASVQTLASVCTGSLVLAQAELLDGLRATTHVSCLRMMQELFPKVQVDAAAHVVSQGRIVTSAGISAGIDMALLLVAEHFGSSIARATARYMEYPYPESLERRIQVKAEEVAEARQSQIGL